jgi:hypothetical protein
MSRTATAAKPNKFGYRNLMTITDRPLADRKLVAIGRGGAKVAPRKFHLSTGEVDQLRAEKRDGAKMPNPHNRGSYFYIIEALAALGLDRKHKWSALVGKVRELMSDPETRREIDGKKVTDWQRFIHKDPATKNEENARDAEGRILQNCEVLQRVNLDSNTPYGLKLLQVGQKVLKTKGCVIDLFKSNDGEISVMLNTNSATPVNELKRRRTGDASKATKTASKPSKGKATKVKATAKKASKPRAARKAKDAASDAAGKTDDAPTGDIAETETAGASA